MVDALREEAIVQAIPRGGLVGEDRGAGATLRPIVDTEAASERNTKGSVSPPRSRMTTTTLRLPVWCSALRRSMRFAFSLAGFT